MSECKYSKCNVTLDARAGQTRYCSGSHKMKAFRERQTAETFQDAQGLTQDATDTIAPSETFQGSTGASDLRQPSPLEDVETGPDTADTSQCYRDSGIPLPGDPGYKGVCRKWAGSGKWAVFSHLLDRPEMLKRYASD